MAKKQNGPNKSQAIREYLHSNPRAGGTEVIAKLAEKGIQVKPSLVYFVKGKLKAGSQRRKKVAQAARAAAASPSHPDPLTLIRDIKSLAAKCGGIGKLKALVEALAE
jgi:hypothetical protein